MAAVAGFDIARSNGWVIHITNTNLDLFPVTEQLAQKHGYGYRRMYRKETDTLSRNYYILLSKDPQFLEQVADDIEDLPEYLKRPRSVPLWTPDRSWWSGPTRRHRKS